MQSVMNLSQALFRIVFKRGSLQRVHYSNNRLMFALSTCVGLLVVAQLWYFDNDVLDTGLLVFVCVSGLLIAASWLTWKVPRKRLMTALLTSLLIAAAALLLLVLAASLPLWEQAPARYGFAGILALLVMLGVSNSLQFALGSPRLKAVSYTFIFALALVLLYTTLQGLLNVVFAS
jgi:hypothetical protein